MFSHYDDKKRNTRIAKICKTALKALCNGITLYFTTNNVVFGHSFPRLPCNAANVTLWRLNSFLRDSRALGTELAKRGEGRVTTFRLEHGSDFDPAALLVHISYTSKQPPLFRPTHNYACC
jgi:hypothetical protein